MAVGAHLGGFAAGGAFALTLVGTGLERRYVAPGVERQVGWSQHPAYFEGQDALASGDAGRARAAFQRVLAERPQQLDARVGLARANRNSVRQGPAPRLSPCLGRRRPTGRRCWPL